MVKNQILIFGVIIISVFLSSCMSDADAGRDIFSTGGSTGIPCSTCHSLDGTSLAGPSLKGIASRAGDRIEGMSAEEYLRQSIVDPHAYVAPDFETSAQMPTTFRDQLSEDEIRKLVVYMLTLTN